MRARRGAELLKKTAAIFDLPGEAIAGEPRVTISGAGQVHVENHRGLLEYDTERVLVNARGMMIRVTGKELTIAAMSDLELVVRGEIAAVELLT